MNTGDISLGDILRDFADINFGLIAVILLAAWLITAVTRRALPWLADNLPSRFRPYLLPLAPIIRLAVIIVALLEIIPLIFDTSSPQNILAVLGAAGLAIGFAFKDYISSIIAGIVAIYEQPYRPGDWVSIDGDYGEVKSVGVRALKIRTPDDSAVVIPHAKMWDTNIINANDGNREHLVVAEFFVLPGHDAAAVRQKLWDVGATSPYTNHSLPIVVIVMEKPWGTVYRLKAYPIDGRYEFEFISDMTVRGKRVLAQMDVKPAIAPAVPNERPVTV